MPHHITINELLAKSNEDLQDWLITNENNTNLNEELKGLILFWQANGKTANGARALSQFDLNGNHKTKNSNLFKYAASLIIIASISIFYILYNNKNYNQYYIEDEGLPIYMSDKKSDYADWMNNYKTGNYSQALQIIKTKTKTDTTNYYTGIIHIKKNDFEKAIGYLSLINKTSVFYYDALYQLGYCYLQNKDYNQSKQIFAQMPSNQTKYYKNCKRILEELPK